MAPKETKKDRERRLKKAEEQLRGAGAVATDAADAPTNAPTDGPTDDDEPEEPLLYNTEGGLMRPGTSAAATNNAVAKVGASPTLSSSDSSNGIAQEKGSARRTGTTGTKAAKRASTRSSRSRSKAPKKAKKSKKARRHRKRESSSSSSSGDRRRGRGCSPSTSTSTSSSSGDSNWEEFYDNKTVIKVRQLLKTAPPRAPCNVSKGRFSFEASSGEVLYVRKADKGKKDK
jgi:hypothetical protein